MRQHPQKQSAGSDAEVQRLQDLVSNLQMAQVPRIGRIMLSIVTRGLLLLLAECKEQED